MGRTDIEFRNRAIGAFCIERKTLIECQKAEGFRLYPIAGQQDALLSIHDPRSSPCFRFLLVKAKRLDFDQHRDFAKKFTDHLRDDRRILRQGVINTNLH